MAEINVERKGPSIWPWIIGLIVLALLIWALVELFGGEEEAEVMGEETTVGMIAAPGAGPSLPGFDLDTAV